MQRTLPELCDGEKAGLQCMLCRVSTAQGCQVRETEIRPMGSGAGLHTPGEGSHLYPYKLPFAHQVLWPSIHWTVVIRGRKTLSNLHEGAVKLIKQS